MLRHYATTDEIRQQVVAVLAGQRKQRGYGNSDAVKQAIGELVNRGWTVKPTGWWRHPATGRATSTQTFEAMSPDGHTVRCFGSDLMLTGEFEPYVEEVS